MNDELLVFVIRDTSTGIDVPVDVISNKTFLAFSPCEYRVTAKRLDEHGCCITYSFIFDPIANKHALSVLECWAKEGNRGQTPFS